MESNSDTTRRIKTSETIFKILNVIYRKDGATATVISNELDMAYSTVHDHVMTLESLKLLRENDGTYHLGLRFLDYGIHAKEKHKVAEIARPHIKELADEIPEAVWLFVEEHDSIVGIHKEGSDIVTPGEWMGKHLPFHCTAGGKAILAHLDEERVDDLLEDQQLDEITDNTITDRAAFKEELDTVREQGYALNNGEAIRNVRGIARAICINDEVLGAVCIVGPKHRLKGDRFRETMPQKLIETVGDIELRLTDFLNTTPFAFDSSV
jgi:DNA-binding IclR family transcriptional regulator